MYYPYALQWETAKEWLVLVLGESKPLLHLHGGLALLIAPAIVTPRSLGSLIPLAAVVLVEAVNEYSDWTRYRVEGWPWDWSAMWGDVAHTLVWPCALFLLARFTRLGERPAKRNSEAVGPAEGGCVTSPSSPTGQ